MEYSSIRINNIHVSIFMGQLLIEKKIGLVTWHFVTWQRDILFPTFRKTKISR